MELGLTLGGGSGCASVAATSSSARLNKSTDLGLALGVKSNERHHPREGSRSDGDPTVLIDSPHLSLDLLPRWSPRETANTDLAGSWEGGLPGAAARGFDVSRVRAAGEEGESVSSPNSVASAFQVDFCIFGGGAEEEKREWAEAATGGGGGEHHGERTTSSRASEEDENGHTRKKLRLSKDQAAFLEESFKEHNTLNPKQKQALAKQLNLRPRQVEVWFQNRRARTKLKQTEVDCEYLKRCCETLTQENRRLHKELQELRALKSSNPYNMQLPATTLTMCPSCKRTSSTPVTATSSAATGSTSASNKVADSTSKPAPFPLSRPKFFPFSSHNNQPQKSAAS